MKQNEFIHNFLPLAKPAGETFELNPMVILAQAAIESAWGQSLLSTEHNNYFGITGYGKPNAYWMGTSVELGRHSLKFRTYTEPCLSFLDYARLIRKGYRKAAVLSYCPEAFAKTIAYSPYINEANGDDREAYRRMLVAIYRQLAGRI